MTLIEVRMKNNGHVIGCCGATCYNGNRAGAERCNCICEGLNHGIGLDAALDNLPRIAQEWRELAGGGYQVRTVRVQLKLFN